MLVAQPLPLGRLRNLVQLQLVPLVPGLMDLKNTYNEVREYEVMQFDLLVDDVEHLLEDLVDDDEVLVLQLRVHHLRHQQRKHLGGDQVHGEAEASVR